MNLIKTITEINTCLHFSVGNIMGSSDLELANNYEEFKEFGKNLKILPTNDQVKELQTILRDRWKFILFTFFLLLTCECLGTQQEVILSFMQIV